jgi:TonB family protein
MNSIAPKSAHYLIPETPSGIDLFMPIMTVTLLCFGVIGYYLRTHNPPPESLLDDAPIVQQAHFIIEEKKPAPMIEKPKLEEKKEAPIDLTEKPLLAQEKNETAEPPPVLEQKPPVRKVYGLRKVYSTGIGASGGMSDAIVGKLGNTLETSFDTIKATNNDLSGTPVSITTVTSFPKLKNTIRPEYTKEMLENRVEGTVRVKILVDADGRVKQVIVLDDLGFGVKEEAAKACFKMEFDPALTGNSPVPTWIMIRIHFKMLDS